MAARGPAVSFVIATHNRRQVLLETLARIDKLGLSQISETIVVDDASSDGTAEAAARTFPRTRVIRRSVNCGPVCKNAALPLVRAPYVVFLDDDSFPHPGSVERMIEHFEANRKLGAAVFDVILPDGSRECSAYPDVFIGCGTGFRTEVLREVGGLPWDFFMQAEEYDLSLRLLEGRWEIRRFDDLRVTHLKSPSARNSARVMELDVRNNLLLIARRFPKQWVLPFARDWMYRYWLMAQATDRRVSYWAGLIRGVQDALRSERRPICERAFERFARVGEIRRRMTVLAQRNRLRRVLFVDLGKNILPYYLAARELGIAVVGIADERLGGLGFRYRGIRIVRDEAARGLGFDAAIVSNSSPVHAERRAVEWGARIRRPVFELLGSGRAAPDYGLGGARQAAA